MRIRRGMKAGMAVFLAASLLFAGAAPVQTAAKTAVKLSKKKISIEKGKTAVIKLSGAKAKVKWSVSDKKKVSLTFVGKYKQKCKIKAKKSGIVKITAKYKKKKYICVVTVTDKKVTPGPQATATAAGPQATVTAGSQATATAGSQATATAGPQATVTPSPQVPVSITLLHTNDVHGNFNGVGIAKVAALKKQSENAVLVDAGDATQGVAFAMLTKGENVIKLMNAAGYDGMALGNHEFDYGLEQLFKNVKMAEFPVAAANVLKDNEPVLKGVQSLNENNGASFTVFRNGIEIGFFCLTTKETMKSTSSASLRELVFEDEVKVAKEQISRLKANGADIVVCLAHMGDDESAGYTSTALAEEMTGEYEGKLNVIIDGHSHTMTNKKVNGIQICQTGTAFAALGRTVLTYDKGRVSIAENAAEILSIEDLEDVEPDTEVEAVFEQLNEDVKRLSNEVIAKAKTSLWGGTVNGVAEARITETNYGNLIADSMISAGEDYVRGNSTLEEKYRQLPITAVVNGGGIRAFVPNGKVTKGHVVNTMPYGNDIYYKVVTPSILYAIMEKSLSKITGQDKETGRLTGEDTNITNSGYLQAGGMKIVYNPAGTGQEKVTAITLDGEKEALSKNDTEREIILASNAYVMQGGGGYTMLAELPVLAKGSTEGDVLLQEIAKRTENGTKELDVPVTENRIVAKGEYEPKDYTVHIRVKHEDESIAAGERVDYYIDNKHSGTTVVDGEGLLNITVPDGPHAIKLYEEQEEVYVNNYTGAGVVFYADWTADYPSLKVR